ncbi:hypothetical protein IU459_11745 [Nocardia amamiensis]|uniref:Transposase n=1 Tax=Nocardia amamiensis TaxID=404578 RepID=A0ABS0CTX2_9NOCA|nr:hypothetical protein [Nocardia amamiensis]MBF6298213.1 hypothetical protein [Nocardia amamiensis]
MPAAWKGSAGAWKLDDRIVHLADPLPSTRDMVSMVVSSYAFRVVVGTCRDRDDVGWLVTEIIKGRLLTASRVEVIADALVEQIFGQPRWVVQRLWREALGIWREVDAELGVRGVDVLALPPDRATNTVYGVLHRRRSHDERALKKWMHELEDTPARVRQTPVGDAAAAADWMALAGMLGGGRAPVAGPAGVDSELTIT